ncbi:hypothetical protein GCM10027063_36730 [Promicromonospora xylanilytica]
MSLNLDRSTWKTFAFGDVIENVTDRVDDPSKAGVDRYVGLEHLDPGVLTIQRWDTPDKVEAQKLRFESGDVIFGRRRAYQKKVAMAEFEGICSAHALVLRARPEVIHPTFLPIFLSSDCFLDRAIAISVGSLSPTVNWRDLKVQEFDLPPLDEQQRLADLLWAVERERNATQTLLLATDTSVQTLVDFLLERAGGVETPLGEVLVTCQYGLSSRAGEDGAFPMLRMTNVRAGTVVGDDLKYCDLSDGEFARYRVHKGDVLFNRTNTAELVGRSGIFNLGENFVFASYLVRLKAAHELLAPEFLNHFINSGFGQRRIRIHVSRGVDQANISAAKLKSVNIPLPSLADQQTIVRQVESLREPRREQATRLDAATDLGRVLRAEIFGGDA